MSWGGRDGGRNGTSRVLHLALQLLVIALFFGTVS